MKESGIRGAGTMSIARSRGAEASGFSSSVLAPRASHIPNPGLKVTSYIRPNIERNQAFAPFGLSRAQDRGFKTVQDTIGLSTPESNKGSHISSYISPDIKSVNLKAFAPFGLPESSPKTNSISETKPSEDRINNKPDKKPNQRKAYGTYHHVEFSGVYRPNKKIDEYQNEPAITNRVLEKESYVSAEPNSPYFGLLKKAKKQEELQNGQIIGQDPIFKLAKQQEKTSLMDAAFDTNLVNLKKLKVMEKRTEKADMESMPLTTIEEKTLPRNEKKKVQKSEVILFELKKKEYQPEEKRVEKSELDIDDDANSARKRYIMDIVNNLFARRKSQEKLTAKSLTGHLPDNPTDEMLSELAKAFKRKWDGSWSAITVFISRSKKSLDQMQNIVKSAVEMFPAVRIRKKANKKASKSDAQRVLGRKLAKSISKIDFSKNPFPS